MSKWINFGCLAVLASITVAQITVAQKDRLDFTLSAIHINGKVYASLPDGNKFALNQNKELPIGTTVTTVGKGTTILVWRPYKAHVKLDNDTQVKLSANRSLVVQKGRIWVGTPPVALGEKRYPLPIQASHAQIVSSPNAIFSIAFQSGGTITVSVDVGSVIVFANKRVVVVSEGWMVKIPAFSPPSILTPMSRQERLLWDTGGPY